MITRDQGKLKPLSPLLLSPLLRIWINVGVVNFLQDINCEIQKK